ncbi:CD1375 family protein [Methanobrevibacter sp.]|uniref:CD1375 family protein n=1 Tax=Methanobrevibacter sp. TaxID=66852 RepID=UPI00386C1C3F
MIKQIKEVITIMAMIYATLIIKGLKKLSQVPAVIRGQVEEILKEVLECEQLPEELL